METEKVYLQLRQVINSWLTLDEYQWSLLASIFQVKTLKNKEYAALPDSEIHEILFVGEGLLRFYYIDEEGAESNKAFIAENDFACPVASAILRLPIFYGVQAIENTVLLSADYNQFIKLCDEHPIFERFGRKLNESLLVHKELRARSLLQKDAKDRYLEFIKFSPHLVQRVPQYHIASYLGVSEVSLSRIRNALARQAKA